MKKGLGPRKGKTSTEGPFVTRGEMGGVKTSKNGKGRGRSGRGSLYTLQNERKETETGKSILTCRGKGSVLVKRKVP